MSKLNELIVISPLIPQYVVVSEIEGLLEMAIAGLSSYLLHFGEHRLSNDC